MILQQTPIAFTPCPYQLQTYVISSTIDRLGNFRIEGWALYFRAV